MIDIVEEQSPLIKPSPYPVTGGPASACTYTGLTKAKQKPLEISFRVYF
jgi:hypothetical protein